MELQDRVTVVLTQHGANVLNNKNKEYNEKFPDSDCLRTDHAAGEFLSDRLFNIIDTFKDHIHLGGIVCFKYITPEIKGIELDKLRVRQKLENFKLKLDKLDVDGINKIMKDLTRQYLERLGVNFEGDTMIMGPVKLTAENTNLTRDKHKNVTIKRCVGVFTDGILTSMYTGDLMPTEIPEEKKDNEEYVSMTVYGMMANAFDAAMDEITMLRAKLKRIQEVIKEQ